MANLPELQLFASQNGFGLTAPLTHQQVVDLAGYWLPQMCFYWDERFHPITLEDMFTMVDAQFAASPPDAQDTWRVNKLLRSGSNTGVIQAFDPPLVHVPDGLVLQGNPPQQFTVPAVRVLAEGTAARDALRLPEVGTGAVVTHGASFNRSNQFFGPQRTLSTGNPRRREIRSCHAPTSPIRIRLPLTPAAGGRALPSWRSCKICSSCSSTS